MADKGPRDSFGGLPIRIPTLMKTKGASAVNAKRCLMRSTGVIRRQSPDPFPKRARKSFISRVPLTLIKEKVMDRRQFLIRTAAAFPMKFMR